MIKSSKFYMFRYAKSVYDKNNKTVRVIIEAFDRVQCIATYNKIYSSVKVNEYDWFEYAIEIELPTTMRGVVTSNNSSHSSIELGKMWKEIYGEFNVVDTYKAYSGNHASGLLQLNNIDDYCKFMVADYQQHPLQVEDEDYIEKVTINIIRIHYLNDIVIEYTKEVDRFNKKKYLEDVKVESNSYLSIGAILSHFKW